MQHADQDGNATTAELHEETGIAFDMNAALVCCIGGRRKVCSRIHVKCSIFTEEIAEEKKIACYTYTSNAIL
jgi:hypothetical protein